MLLNGLGSSHVDRPYASNLERCLRQGSIAGQPSMVRAAPFLSSFSPAYQCHPRNQHSHYDNDESPEWEICRVSNVKLSPAVPTSPTKSYRYDYLDPRPCRPSR